MIETIKKIFSSIELSVKEKISVIIASISPFIFSAILFLSSFIFHIEFIDPRLKFYSLISWLFCLSYFLGLFLMFFYQCTQYKSFKQNKHVIIKSIINLMNLRLRDKKDFIYFSIVSFLLFYFLTLAPIFIRYNLFLFTLVYFVMLNFLLMGIKSIINTFTGLQESHLKRYLGLYFLFLSFFLYYLLNFTSVISVNFNMVNSSVLTKATESAILPIIIAIVPIFTSIFLAERRIKKHLPKKGKPSWEKSIDFSIFLSQFILCFALLMFLLGLTVSFELISVVPIDLEKIILIGISVNIFITLYISYLFLYPLSSFFIKNMNDWGKFFDCYNGPNTTEFNNNQIVKISGRCIAISINEKYREKYENFNQHLLIKIEKANKNIDVISLEEKNPFKNTLRLVNESDEVKVIGEIKSILNDEALFIKQKRISNLILAYHIEPKITDRQAEDNV